MSGRALAVLAGLTIMYGCATEPELEFADWHLPVPEGTSIIEYGPIPVAERDPEAVQLIEDLVIGGDVDDPAAVLYSPRDVVAADDGTIFVADGDAEDIKVFAADGRYQRTLGREGQGPGEFGRISGMTIAGDHLVVNDNRNNRFSIWTLDGEHVADHTAPNRFAALWMAGLADGTLVSLTLWTNSPEDRGWALDHHSSEGDNLGRLAAVPQRPLDISDRSRRAMIQQAIEQLRDPRLMAAVGSGETVYVSPALDYQVLSMTPDGVVTWALRVAWPRPAFPEATKQLLVDSFVSSISPDEPLAVDDIDWPEDFASVSHVATDGHGRLYVFAFEEMTNVAEAPDAWPVEVFTPAGERIASGVVPAIWTYARGDHVYGRRTDENEENVVVRYRLVVNQN